MTNLHQDAFQNAFQLAVAELSDLQRQREQKQKEVDSLDERMEKVRQGALGLAALVNIDFERIKRDHPRLFSEEHDPKLGITEAVKMALRETDGILSPKEIKDRVLRISPAVAGHKNPMASIHAVLRRLVDADEVFMAVYEETGRTVYGWVGDNMDRQTIKRRLFAWFSNGEYTYQVNQQRWANREEGTVLPIEVRPRPKTRARRASKKR